MPTTTTTDLVFKVLDECGELSPLAFLEAMKRKNVDEAAAKEAVSYMLNDGLVEMTENRRLRLSAVAA